VYIDLLQRLQQGGLVGFPTDTVYALAADPRQGRGLEALYEIKGRPSVKAVALLAQDIAMIEHWALMTAENIRVVEKLDSARPGLLTFIVPASAAAPRGVVREGKIAFRLPKSRTPLFILRELGAPVAATSLNRSGAPAAVLFEEIEPFFKRQCLVIPDLHGEVTGVASTVVDLSRPNFVQIFRLGAVSAAVISAELGSKYGIEEKK
jgi:L-threonylcarbamoyladenylate synthase